jgi:aspartate dehydrogenase
MVPEEGMGVRIGLLGYGTVGRILLQRLLSDDLEPCQVVAVAGRPDESSRLELGALGIAYTSHPPDLLEHDLDLVVEAASQSAVRDWAELLLQQGISLVVLSAGALADEAFRSRVEVAAAAGRSYVYLPPGAVGGVDALKAAAMGKLRSVRLTTTKLAGALGAGGDITDPQTVFQGSAGEAARVLPQNMNVAAILGMAGIGAEHTEVQVVVDPGIAVNMHRVEAEGDFGRLEVVVRNRPCPANPRTSYLAVLSAVALLKGLQQRIRVGI